MRYCTDDGKRVFDTKEEAETYERDHGTAEARERAELKEFANNVNKRAVRLLEDMAQVEEREEQFEKKYGYLPLAESESFKDGGAGASANEVMAAFIDIAAGVEKLGAAVVGLAAAGGGEQ